MSKQYQSPELSVILADDVIRTSGFSYEEKGAGDIGKLENW